MSLLNAGTVFGDIRELSASGFEAIYLSEGPIIPSLADSDAAAIVRNREEAKELAREKKATELSGADVLDVAVSDLGHQKVIFNRVAHVPSCRSEDIPEIISRSSTEETSVPAELLERMRKPYVTLALSGAVDEDGISELWWTDHGRSRRIFTNANFLYFTCALGEFESETAHYSVFMVVTPRGGHDLSSQDEWRPVLSDFTPGVLEYLIAEPRRISGADKAAFAGIEAMLTHYAEHSEEMKVAYENRLKIQRAKRAYDAAHPRGQHDVIVNYAPLRGEAAR